jgi:hypothetical protein
LPSLKRRELAYAAALRADLGAQEAALQLPELEQAAWTIGRRLFVAKASDDEALKAAFALLLQQRIGVAAEAGAVNERDRALGFTYPPGLYSLSHVALPFPMNDSLYGLTPDRSEDFGVNPGALAPRGERNVLIASLDSLLRVSPIHSFRI